MENTLKTPKQKWFSIAEAAESLDVGEPTIYRWMREGKITFRKVGDSTRFWQEDLDSVMEVFHSGKDVEKVMEVCPVCHAGELVAGRLQSTGLNYFLPNKAKFWTLKVRNIETEARMCERCGSISLFGNTKKLQALKGGAKALAEGAAKK